MVNCYLFARNYSKYLLSYDKLFKDVYTKPKKIIKYKELKGKKNIFCKHVSNKLEDNIKYYYKYIYPKR
jgi:hypothetical protein